MIYTLWLCCIVLSILKTLCGVFTWYVFLTSFSLSLRVLERWRRHLLGVFLVVIKSFPCFLHLGTYSVFGVLFLSLGHLPSSSCLPVFVFLFTLWILSVCAFTDLLFGWEIQETIRVGFPTDFLNHPKSSPFGRSNSFLFRLCKRDLVLLPQFSVFAVRKLLPTPVLTEADDCSSELQLAVPGSFLLPLEPSEPFMFPCDLRSSSSRCSKQTPQNKKMQTPCPSEKSVFNMCLSTWHHLWIWMCSFLQEYILLYSSPSVFSSPWKTRYLKIFIFAYFSRTLCTLPS